MRARGLRARLTSRTATLCSLGGLPFFFFGRMSRLWAGVANALACGVMLAASFDLIHEARACTDAAKPAAVAADRARSVGAPHRPSSTEASHFWLESCLAEPSLRC